MRYYFAGGLFDHKELIGNKLLADAIADVSAGRWEALLPQNEENQLRDDPKSIRDNDFQMVLKSDAALFNFDGTELDSGTVAEFMAARFIDLPCVVLRSDFRKAGDQNIDGEAWNLMLSGYPGTVTLSFDSMNEYQRAFRGKETFEALKCFYTEMAEKIVAALDEVYGRKPVLSKADAAVARDILKRSCGIAE